MNHESLLRNERETQPQYRWIDTLEVDGMKELEHELVDHLNGFCTGYLSKSSENHFQLHHSLVEAFGLSTENYDETLLQINTPLQ